MKIKIVLLLTTIMSAVFTSGCSLKMPMSPNEFKAGVPESMFGKVDDYTANNSLKKITQTFEQRTKECFQKTINMSTCLKGAGVNSCSDSTFIYTPKLAKEKNELTLTIQKKRKGEDVILGQTIPKDGYYVFLTEITSVNSNSSEVKSYYGQHAGSEKFAETVKSWTSGNSEDCPDITY